MNGGKVSGIALRRELMTFAKMRQKRADRIADQITAFAGSLQFVYIHVAWFTAWIITAHERINQARASRPWRRRPVRERDRSPRGCARGHSHTGLVTACRTRPTADRTRNAIAISITP